MESIPHVYSDENVIKTIQDLITTIEKNSEITSKQNERMVTYNRWLCGLTVAIAVFTVVQIIITLCK